MTFKEKMKLLFSGMWDFLAPMLKAFATTAGQIALQSAMRGVIQAHSSNGTSKEKWQIAKDYVVADLMSKGVTVGTSVINAAIEAAVQKLKEEK